MAEEVKTEAPQPTPTPTPEEAAPPKQVVFGDQHLINVMTQQIHEQLRVVVKNAAVGLRVDELNKFLNQFGGEVRTSLTEGDQSQSNLRLNVVADLETQRVKGVIGWG